MSISRSRSRTLVLLLTGLLALSLASCSKKKKPEDVIRETLDAATTALAEKRIGDAGDALADDYKDSTGRDKRKMKAIALFATQAGNIHLKRTDETITVDGGKATVHCKVWAVQTSQDAKVVADLIPQGRAVEVEITLRRDGDDWLVTAIDGDGTGGMYDG